MIRFTIPGPPVPYLRMTQGQIRLMRIPDHKLRPDGLKVKDRIRRYLRYKEATLMIVAPFSFDRAPRNKVFLNVTCYFKNRKHPDPENVRKGISDAIFTQDKYVAGLIDFFYDQANPRVEVEIVE